MGVLGVILLVIFVITCILLILMVIIQDSDSDSLGGVFAGGSGSAFGSRSTNVVIRFTYVLGALFFVVSFSLALINKTPVGNVEKAAAENKTEQTANSEWWNAKPQSQATDAQGSSGGSGEAPAQSPAPASK